MSSLQHSPCAATVGELTQCITTFQQFYAAQRESDAALAAPTAMCNGGCAAFESASSCDETVIQGVYATGTASLCGTDLPIDVGANCADGGS